MKRSVLTMYWLCASAARALLAVPRRAVLQYVPASVAIASGTEAAAPPVSSPGPDATQIDLYGEISSEACFALTRAIRNADRTAPVHLHVQSYGGDLLAALYASDVIAGAAAPVHTFVDGYAASAATLLTVAGTHRVMAPHSTMMIHQLSAGTNGRLSGMQQDVRNFEKFMHLARDVYLSKTKLCAWDLDRLLREERWLDAPTCVRYGLVDEIVRAAPPSHARAPAISSEDSLCA